MISEYFLTRDGAKGSAADNKTIASWKDEVWTVVLIRPLGLINADDKTLTHGAVYNVGFAVHDCNITRRGHHASFVRTLGFGVKAGIQAVTLSTRMVAIDHPCLSGIKDLEGTACWFTNSAPRVCPNV